MRIAPTSFILVSVGVAIVVVIALRQSHFKIPDEVNLRSRSVGDAPLANQAAAIAVSRWKQRIDAANRGDEAARKVLLEDLTRCWRAVHKQQYLERVKSLADPNSVASELSYWESVETNHSFFEGRSQLADALIALQKDLKRDMQFCQGLHDADAQFEQWLFISASSGDSSALDAYLAGAHLRMLDGSLVDDPQRVLEWRARATQLLARQLHKGDQSALRMMAVALDSGADESMRSNGLLAASPDPELATRYYALAERAGACQDDPCRNRLTELYSQLDDTHLSIVVEWVDANCSSTWKSTCLHQP